MAPAGRMPTPVAARGPAAFGTAPAGSLSIRGRLWRDQLTTAVNSDQSECAQLRPSARSVELGADPLEGELSRGPETPAARALIEHPRRGAAIRCHRPGSRTR